MYLQHYLGQALHCRGFDLYTLLTWRARWDLYRPRVVRVAVVICFAWLMRVLYLSAPDWFGVRPALDALGLPL